MSSSIVSQLEKILGPSNVLTDPQSLKHYGRDWTKFYEPRPQAIALPTSTEIVQEVVRWARATHTPLVPSGGRTGLSGGAVASQNEVVVSLEKMNRILGFNPADLTIHCQAGVVTQALQEEARKRGFYFPIDFASKGSSQIGGNIATNAGGVKVIRYGLTREWVAGLKVVAGTGDILECNQGLVKNATGYDFRHLFIGSEGTLGLVTEATIKLTRVPEDLTVLLLGLSQMSDVMKVFGKYRGIELTAFEFFSEQALSHVCQHSQLAKPLSQSTPFYVLLEFELAKFQEKALQLFEKCVEDGLVVDGIVSQNEVQAKSLWRYREDISESLAQHTPYKNDISVRISDVPELLRSVDQVIKQQYPHFEIVWFGHIGDGNMHVNILKPQSMAAEEFVSHCRKVDAILFGEIQRLKGSISAEHGVGLVKKSFLHFTRSPAEIGLMKQIKRAFDPDGILNPGKIFD